MALAIPFPSSNTSNSLQSLYSSESKLRSAFLFPDSIIFRIFEDGYTVRSMTPSDAVTVQEWQGGLGFRPRHDLPILLDLHPPGPLGLCRREVERQPVGTAVP